MIKNISFYHFYKPSYYLLTAQKALLKKMKELGIRGTILLAKEGINTSFAGPREQADLFLEFLIQTIKVPNLNLKISYSQEIPFLRAVVKIKPHIVAPPGKTPIDNLKDSAPFLSPEDLDQWIQEGKKMILLDTRNDYEYQAGRFKNSSHLGTKHFRDFEGDLQKAPQEWKNTTIVTFCTGGIRCEKAAPLMLKKGFREVYQLDGGILNYFKKIGRGHFEGNCFVFDDRVVLDEELNPK